MVGEILQQEQFSNQPFHQPIGLCVSLPNLSPESNDYCNNPIEDFGKTYLLPEYR